MIQSDDQGRNCLEDSSSINYLNRLL